MTPRPGAFITGLRLAGEFYTRAVRPILDAALPGVPHSAALLGPGSDVLGFDTPRSTDHDWGPRLLLFLHPEDRAHHGQRLHERLAYELPTTFAGYLTSFAPVSGTTAPPAPTRSLWRPPEAGGVAGTGCPGREWFARLDPRRRYPVVPGRPPTPSPPSAATWYANACSP